MGGWATVAALGIAAVGVVLVLVLVLWDKITPREGDLDTVLTYYQSLSPRRLVAAYQFRHRQLQDWLTSPQEDWPTSPQSESKSS